MQISIFFRKLGVYKLLEILQYIVCCRLYLAIAVAAYTITTTFMDIQTIVNL